MGYGSAGATRPDKTGFRAHGFTQRIPSAAEWAKYPDEIRAFCERLQGVILECKPALEVIRGHDAQDVLFYCDPPYVFSTRSSALDRRKHYAAEMTDEQHEELAEALHSIRGMAIISGYRCELYDRLYADWVRLEKGARSMLNIPRIECIWLSPNVQAIQMELEER